jgi:hypothetical protein
MYYLIINGVKVAENTDFDKLVDMADENGGGFVVEAKDWNRSAK